MMTRAEPRRVSTRQSRPERVEAKPAIGTDCRCEEGLSIGRKSVKGFAAGGEICANPFSARLPELLPGLDELLDGPGGGDAIIDHAASRISRLISVADRIEAQAGKAVAILLEVFRAHDFVGPEIGAARHKGRIAYSLFIRYQSGCGAPWRAWCR